MFRVVVDEQSVFCLKLFVGSALYGESCTASGDLCGVWDLCRGGILLSLCQGFFDFVHHLGIFETVCSCTFDNPQAYQWYRPTVQVGCNSDENIGSSLYTAGYGVVTGFPDWEVAGCKRSLHDELISIRIDTVNVYFLVDHLFPFADAGDDNMAALDPSKELVKTELAIDEVAIE